MANWTNYPITHGFITSYSGGDTPHYAVDLGTPFHTPLTALWAGTVKQADYATWGGSPGGGEVFIQPDAGGDQYYLYHLDEIDVRPGQHLAQGQLIGLSGGQNVGGEHPVSPNWSSGPHTHLGFFEKYVSTPAGDRPYGPDITSSLASGMFGGSGTGSVNGPPGLTNPSNLGSLIPGVDGLGAAGQTLSDIGKINYVDLGYRALFMGIGLILLFLGLRHFMSFPSAPQFTSEPEQPNLEKILPKEEEEA